MNRLCGEAVDFLEAVCDRENALFPVSTRLVDGRYESHFRGQDALRHTIVCLLGLSEAARHEPAHSFLCEIDRLVADFVRQHGRRLSSYADLGLLLALLVATGDTGGHARSALERLRSRLVTGRVGALTMQDLSWMLWGTTTAAQNGLSGARSVAASVFRVMQEGFVHTHTQLPRHSLRRYRRNIVSFGSVAYFLRSIHDYSVAFGDTGAERSFARAVRGALALQSPSGAWPWLIDVRTGLVLDPYPVFTVHQLSMAMLFLHPAQALGLVGARRAAEASLDWMKVPNELGTALTRDDPFFIYRSIERRDRLPRARRYLRAMQISSVDVAGNAPDRACLRVNRTSQSYEWGWLLFVWSGREDPLREAPPSAVAALSDSDGCP